MAPFIKSYKDDEEVKAAIQKLKDNKVGQEDIYVLSHDDDRTKRVAESAGTNTIGTSEMGIGDVVKGKFEKKGDELRSKLQHVGFSEAEAESFEEDMDQGIIFLIVTKTDNVENMLV